MIRQLTFAFRALQESLPPVHERDPEDESHWEGDDFGAENDQSIDVSHGKYAVNEDPDADDGDDAWELWYKPHGGEIDLVDAGMGSRDRAKRKAVAHHRKQLAKASTVEPPIPPLSKFDDVPDADGNFDKTGPQRGHRQPGSPIRRYIQDPKDGSPPRIRYWAENENVAREWSRKHIRASLNHSTSDRNRADHHMLHGIHTGVLARKGVPHPDGGIVMPWSDSVVYDPGLDSNKKAHWSAGGWGENQSGYSSIGESRNRNARHR